MYQNWPGENFGGILKTTSLKQKIENFKKNEDILSGILIQQCFKNGVMEKQVTLL